jgi:hypothetical protein
MLTFHAQVHMCYFTRQSCQKKLLFCHRTIKFKVNLILQDPYNRYFYQTMLHFNIFTFFYIFICLTDLLAYAIVTLFHAAHCESESFLIMDQTMWEAELCTIGGSSYKQCISLIFIFMIQIPEFH